MGPFNMPSGVYVDGLEVPVYVALATLCERAPYPYKTVLRFGLARRSSIEG
jgi:hypothetical protein